MPSGKPVGPVTQADVAAEIERVAAVVNKDPWKVNYADMVRESPIPERRILLVGGLPSIKATFFGAMAERDDAEIRSTAEVRNQVRGLRNKLGDIEALHRRMEMSVEGMQKIPVSKWQAKKHKKDFERDLHLIISDLHLGANLDPRETLVKYGEVEESRALAYVAKNVCSYKIEHRPVTSLTVDVLGDIIENHLHPGGSSDALHIQTCRAIHLLTQFFDVLSNNFPRVRVMFAVGNHGRDKSIHPQRATASKYNALETTIYYAVKKAFSKHKNIEFFQPRTPWVDYETFGSWTYACHGDTNFSVGSVGSKINVSAIEAKVHKLNSDRSATKKYRVFHVGHLHQATMFQLSTGEWVIVNGALTPPNPYAQTLNITRCSQNQVMYESTEDHPVGDFRVINANGSDKDKSLDEIIQPFTDL